MQAVAGSGGNVPHLTLNEVRGARSARELNAISEESGKPLSPLVKRFADYLARKSEFPNDSSGMKDSKKATGIYTGSLQIKQVILRDGLLPFPPEIKIGQASSFSYNLRNVFNHSPTRRYGRTTWYDNRSPLLIQEIFSYMRGYRKLLRNRSFFKNNYFSMENRILIVEDEDISIKDIVKAFEENGIKRERLDIARNLIEVHIHIGENFTDGIKKYVAVILDGTLTNYSKPPEDTYDLLNKLKESGFDGPIIAASHSESALKMMMLGGCTHKIPEFKHQVAKLIADLLKKAGK